MLLRQQSQYSRQAKILNQLSLHRHIGYLQHLSSIIGQEKRGEGKQGIAPTTAPEGHHLVRTESERQIQEEKINKLR
ncbi:unnamed protein product [Acanthoscelides obtectus]|uniref:Uncharacterized protein n=1 Tax=Acanthoscelides obtectus TaxID=200917 RepID=A0A9P0PLX9_ACAOB|nr:unnamed protein product [Acanthoscelides obtectus]CAK1630858.1 hypothetical protein AOBTE_LOCUS6593 [Acanthoscelides obtectus]